MKKVLLVMIFSSALLMAEESFASKLSFGVSTGLSITLEESIYDDINLVGVPVLVQGLYRLTPTFEIPNLGTTTIDVGVKMGYLHLWDYSSSSLEMNMYTIPFLAYARANVGNFFVGAGLGLHFWNLDMTILSIDGGDNGVDFCSTIEPGYALSINENLTLLGSISIFSTSYEGSSSDNSSSILTLNIGIEYAL